jgi:YVTN family beta-propeller protein
MKSLARYPSVVIAFGLILQAAVLSAAKLHLTGPSGYHITKRTVLGGEGGWDYLTVDSKARRIYISHATHVMVVDADTNAVLGDIPNTNGVHGIALVPEVDKGFTSNGRDNAVTVFDLKTLKPVANVPVGRNPDAIVYDPFSKRVFAFNGASHDATAIDVKTNSVVGTIALGGKPEFAVSDEKGNLYVNIEDKNEIVRFDPIKLTVENRWSIAPGEEPSGLAIDRKHRRLFSVCGNKLMAILNADNGKVITMLPIGNGTDAAAFDPETGFAFSSNGEGTLTVVHEDSPDKFTVVENVPTQVRARTMALDAKTHQVFLVSAEFGTAPAATAQQPRPRAPMVPGTFTLIVLSR